MVRRLLLEQRLSDRCVAQVIQPVIQVLLYYAARLLLPGKGVKLRHGTFSTAALCPATRWL